MTSNPIIINQKDLVFSNATGLPADMPMASIAVGAGIGILAGFVIAKQAQKNMLAFAGLGLALGSAAGFGVGKYLQANKTNMPPVNTNPVNPNPTSTTNGGLLHPKVPVAISAPAFRAGQNVYIIPSASNDIHFFNYPDSGTMIGTIHKDWYSGGTPVATAIEMAGNNFVKVKVPKGAKMYVNTTGQPVQVFQDDKVFFMRLDEVQNKPY